MTVKQFFKSTSFKCIAALLSILLVCGVFLTICYGFMEVTEGERLQRAIKAIYGKEVIVYGADDKEITSSDSDPQGLISTSVTYGQAEILQAYKVAFYDSDEINYLISSKGKGGYGGGSVTCWISVEVDENGITGLGKVSVASNVGQSFIGKITDGFLNSFAGGYADGVYYQPSDGYLSSGATLSSTAICNAVNGAIAFVKAEILGEASDNVFEDFDYTDYIDTTNPNTKFTVTGTDVTYNIVTLGNGYAGAFTLTITVGADEKVSAYEIVVDGGTTKGNTDYKTLTYDTENYIGKGLDYFLSAMNDGKIDTGVINSGASLSNYLCVYAGAFATANYDKCISIGGGN